VLMASSPEDRVAYASLYGRDQADLVLGLERFRASVSIMDGLAGRRQSEILVLDDWWGEPIPGQLAGLQQAAHAHTLPKREVVTRNNGRYWDRLDAIGARQPAGATDERSRQPVNTSSKRPKGPPGPRPPQSPARPATTLRNNPARDPDPDVARPASLLDGPPDL